VQFVAVARNYNDPLLQVPLAQKWLIQKANLAGKPAFVAGQVRKHDAFVLRQALAARSTRSSTPLQLHACTTAPPL
jgi:hypothetical protein